jgi:hypothetical protein
MGVGNRRRFAATYTQRSCRVWPESVGEGVQVGEEFVVERDVDPGGQRVGPRVMQCGMVRRSASGRRRDTFCRNNPTVHPALASNRCPV